MSGEHPLDAPIRAMQAAFLELLQQHTTVYGAGDGFTVARGIAAREHHERMVLDPDEVVDDLRELVRRDLASRDLPPEVVLALSAPSIDDETGMVTVPLTWLEREPG